MRHSLHMLSNTNPPNHTPKLPPHAKAVFTGEIFTVYQWDQELYDGTHVTFERLTRADTAGVLAILPSGEIILTQQEQPQIEPFTGPVGGFVDPGESPFEAAQRELLEEAGYRSDPENWEHLFTVVPYTKVQWAMHYFVAKNCVKATDAQNLDGGEKIELFTIQPDQLLETVLQPTWNDHALTYFLLRTHYEPQQWQTFLQRLRP